MGFLEDINQDKLKVDSRFISVHALVTKFSKTEKCSISEAASAILYLLKGKSVREVVKYYSEISGTNEYENLMQHGICSPTHKLLQTVQRTNEFYVIDALLSDSYKNKVFPHDIRNYKTYGWVKCDLAKFFGGSQLYSWIAEEGGIQDGHFCGDSQTLANANSPSYSNKLAAAIAAHEAVTSDEKYRDNGKSPKANIISWLKENAEELGLIKPDGTINKHAIEGQIAPVANSDVGGGTPSTPNK